MNKTSTSTNWSGPFLKSRFCKGKGLVIEGIVKEVRVHSVFVRSTDITNQEDNLPTRYFALTIEPKQVYDRLFCKDGQEVDYTDNNKRSKDYVEPHLLDHNQLLAKLGGVALPNGLIDERKNSLHPKVKGHFEFWIDSERPKAKDIIPGHELRILTLGDSIFIDDFKMLNAKLNVFKAMGDTGATLSGEYADNILKYAEPDEDVVDTREGVDEDEWSD